MRRIIMIDDRLWNYLRRKWENFHKQENLIHSNILFKCTYQKEREKDEIIKYDLSHERISFPFVRENFLVIVQFSDSNRK